ncbi:hypothetical protein [Streptomyces sp. NPDC127190]
MSPARVVRTASVDAAHTASVDAGPGGRAAGFRDVRRGARGRREGR